MSVLIPDFRKSERICENMNEIRNRNSSIE